MALSVFDDPPTGIDDSQPTTAKRYASKKLKQQQPIGAPQQDDGSQLSSMMPGKPTSPIKQQTDEDKQYAIRRRLRRSGVTN